MDLNKKLEKLKPYQLNCNVFDVYSYNGLTMQDLLCQFFTKINECITVSNETLDLAKWLVNEGLEIEVVKKLMIWLEDGTIENIINEKIFNELNSKINVLTDFKNVVKTEYNIYPDDFEGSDTEKLQKSIDKAVDLAIENDFYPVIIINRNYYVEKSLTIKGDEFWSWFKIKGEGGAIVFKFAGYLFTGKISQDDHPKYHAPLLENIYFYNDANIFTCLYDNRIFLRMNIQNCIFRGVSCVSGEGYIQTLRFVNNEITAFGGCHFINGSMAYDCDILQNRFESQGSDLSCVNIIEKVKNLQISYMSLRIQNNVIEGHVNADCIVLGNGYGLSINDNYFEMNKNNIMISKGHGTERVSGTIRNNTFMNTLNKTKTSIILNGVINYYLDIDYNTSSDAYLCNVDTRADLKTEHNNVYAEGQLYPITYFSNIAKPQSVIVGENNGKVTFKAKINKYQSRQTMCGNFIFNLQWGINGSPLYRGCGTFNVALGNVYISGLKKKLNISLVSGIATNQNNGDYSEGYRVYFDDTETDLIDVNQDFTYITIEINASCIDNSKGSWYLADSLQVENFIVD